MSDPNLFKLLGGYLHKKTKGERLIKLTKKNKVNLKKKSTKKRLAGGKRSRSTKRK